MKRKTKEYHNGRSTRNDANAAPQRLPQKYESVPDRRKNISEKSSHGKNRFEKARSLSSSDRILRQSVSNAESKANKISKTKSLPLPTKSRKALNNEKLDSPRNVSNRRTRSFERSLPRRPFHKARVLIVVDGTYSDLGTISSESIPSPSSETSSIDTSNSMKFVHKKIAPEESSKIYTKTGSKTKGKRPLLGSARSDGEVGATGDCHKNDSSEKLIIRSTISFPKDNSKKSLLEDEAKVLSNANRGSASGSKEGSDTERERGDTFDEMKDDDGRPVKEIDTSKSFEDVQNSDKIDSHTGCRTRSKQIPTKSRVHSSGPQLDEETMTLLKEYVLKDIEENKNNRLGFYRSEKLSENDIELLTAKTIRLADEQTRYEAMCAPVDQSDTDDDDYSCYMNNLKEIEEQTVNQEYFKKVTSKMRKDVRMRSQNGTPATSLDKRTLNWVRRKVSQPRKRHILQDNRMSDARRKEDHEIQSLSDGSVKGPKRVIATRRFTRNLAQQGRKRKRSLDVLCLAIDELGMEFSSSAEGIEENSLSTPDLTQCEDSKPLARNDEGKIALSQQSSDGVVLLRIKATDDNVFNKDKNKTKIEVTPIQERKATTDYPIDASSEIEKNTDAPLVPTVCTNLRELDRLWRKKQNSLKNGKRLNSKARLRWESEEDFVKRRSIELHPTFKEANVVHRLPRWHNFVSQDEKILRETAAVADPPMSRHSKDVYGDLCNRLINCLKGRARLFANCEFFYSDLDRPWYNENLFAQDAEQLGVPSGSLLSRKEWKAVRRRIGTKPRIFSKKFIRSQLSKRNQYRNTVRKIQRNPNLARSFGFQYDVCAPIRVGATVNAYNKRYRIVQRGIVLTYDYDTALYLILFESKQFGYELCPDTDVASCGPPSLLHRGCKETIRGNVLTDRFNSSLFGCRLSFSGLNPSQVECLKNTQKKKPLSTVAASLKPTHSNESDVPSAVISSYSKSLTEEVAEHEAFLTLVRTIERARVRKNTLIEAIDDTNALLIGQLPFGDDFVPADLNMSKSAQDHLNWLLANLGQTNHVLRTALTHLRKLYGKAYEDRNFRDKIENSAIKESNEDNLKKSSQVVSKSESILMKRFEKLGHLLSTSIFDRVPIAMDEMSKDDIFLKSRLCAVAQILCISECGEKQLGSQNVCYNPAWTAEALHLAMTNFNNIAIPASDSVKNLTVDASAHVFTHRNAAIEDLNVAVSLFNSELKLASSSS